MRLLICNRLIFLWLIMPLAGCVHMEHELISDDTHYARGLAHLKELRKDELPAGELDLAMVVAHVLKRNTQHQLALLEEVIAGYDLTLAQYAMLPRVTAQAAYSWRNNSPELIGSPSFVDLEKWRLDLGLEFNLLDFGISYYVAKQTANSVLAAAERRSGVIRRLIWDAEVAFWEAGLAQRLLPGVVEVLALVEQALPASRGGAELSNPLESLRYQQRLLAVVSTLREMESHLRMADARLAGLLSLPPDQRVRCALPDESPLEVLDEAALPVLEQMVLVRRSDLREVAYQEQIDIYEVKRNLVELVPGVRLVAGLLNHNTSSAVMHQNWREAGLQVSRDLVELFTGAGQRRVERAKARLELRRQRALGLTVAALTQLHTAFWNWRGNWEVYRLADELHSVAGEIGLITQNQAAAGLEDDLVRIQTEVDRLQAALERDMAYVEVRRGLGQIFVVAGLDPVSDIEVETATLEELSGRIEEYLAERMELLGNSAWLDGLDQAEVD